jgi:hypothetical protein
MPDSAQPNGDGHAVSVADVKGKAGFIGRDNQKDGMAGDNAKKSTDYDVTEHLLSVSEVAQKLSTNVNAENPSKSPGLTAAEVRAARSSGKTTKQILP